MLVKNFPEERKYTYLFFKSNAENIFTKPRYGIESTDLILDAS